MVHNSRVYRLFKIIVILDKEYNATYLPEVSAEHFGEKKITVESLIRKTGYMGDYQNVMSNIKCERYQSCKTKLTFDEYLTLKGMTK